MIAIIVSIYRFIDARQRGDDEPATGFLAYSVPEELIFLEYCNHIKYQIGWLVGFGVWNATTVISTLY